MCTENFLVIASGCARRKDSEVNAVTTSGALANNESTYVPADAED
jgi:hypothetical protein